jgi:hypothetical protein
MPASSSTIMPASSSTPLSACFWACFGGFCFYFLWRLAAFLTIGIATPVCFIVFIVVIFVLVFVLVFIVTCKGKGLH